MGSFFKLLKKYWGNCPKSIYLNTEEKSYDCDFLDVKVINNRNTAAWTERIRGALEQIEEEYVLFFLDDFFLTNTVSEELFEEAVSKLSSSNDCGAVFFQPLNSKDVYTEDVDKRRAFCEVSTRTDKCANVMVTLFRREYLKRLLCKNENPWKYERNASVRARALGCRIFTQNYKMSKPLFWYYLKPRDNMGLTQGRWCTGTIALFENNGIFDVDFSRLGLIDTSEKAKNDGSNSKKESAVLTKIPLREKIHGVVKKVKYSTAGNFTKFLYYRVYYIVK